ADLIRPREHRGATDAQDQRCGPIAETLDAEHNAVRFVCRHLGLSSTAAAGLADILNRTLDSVTEVLHQALWAGFSLSTVSARSELDRSAHTTAGIGVPATSGQGAAGEQNACVGGDDRGEEDREGGEHAAQSRCRQKP